MEIEQKKDKQPLLLVVDDIVKNIQLIGNVLQKENYRISLANNGKQAIAIATEIRPDLILLDVMMKEKMLLAPVLNTIPVFVTIIKIRL